MKKLFCVLFLLVFLTVSAACAEQHLQLSCSFSGSADSRFEKVDLYEQEGKMFAVSTLFPEYAAEMDANRLYSFTDMRILLASDPSMILQAGKKADMLLKGWLETMLSAPENGVYAGSLFEQAHTERKCRIKLSDITVFFGSDTVKQNTVGEESEIISAMTGMAARTIIFLTGINDPELLVQNYDEGRFLTFQVADNDEVIMIVSSENISENEKRFMISFRENGRYYFRDILVRAEEESITWQSSLTAGSESSYPAVSANAPLYTEKYMIRKTDERGSYFEWILQSDTLAQPLTAAGAVSGQQDGPVSVDAVVSIEGQETELMRVSVCLETTDSPVSLSGKQIIQTDNEKEVGTISLVAAANAASLAAEILPSLPEEYQRILMNLLYQ